MDTVSVDRDIAAPPERVWTLVSDVTRMGEWSPEATGGTWRKGATGPAVGAQFKGTNSRGRRSWSTSCRVVNCDPNARFGFAVSAGPLGVSEWDYAIVPTPTGCRVTETWTDARGAIIRVAGKLLTGVADRSTHNRAGMEQTLAALAAAAERAD